MYRLERALNPLPAKPVAQGPEDATDSSQEATEIRSDIEKTRSNLSATIDALQDKLDPSRIAEQVKDQIREKATEAFDTAKHAVKEATIGKAEHIMSSVSEAVSDMTGRAGTAMSDSGSSIVQYIRDNPVPIALVGIGLGMLAMRKRQAAPSTYPASYVAAGYPSNSSPEPSLADRARGVVGDLSDRAQNAASTVSESARAAADRATSAVTSAASTVQDAAGQALDATRRQYHDVRGQAKQGVQVANDTFQNTLQDNPLALGIAALAAGALVGLSLPSTQVEGQYMGEARDKLVDQAKSLAQDAAGKVQRVAEQAGQTLQGAGQQVGQTIQEAAQKEGLVASS